MIPIVTFTVLALCVAMCAGIIWAASRSQRDWKGAK